MKLFGVVPYLIYALLAVLLGVVVKVVLVSAAPDSGDWLRLFLLHALVTPIVLFLARRYGDISYGGLFATSAVLLFLTYWTVVVTLDRIAQPVGGSAGWSDLIVAIGWPRLALSAFLNLSAPLFWLAVLRHAWPSSSNGHTARSVI